MGNKFLCVEIYTRAIAGGATDCGTANEATKDPWHARIRSAIARIVRPVLGVGLAALTGVTLGPDRASAASFQHPLGCGAGPNDFRVTTFASGLNFPYGMAQLADGSLLVASSKPNTLTGGYFASTGELLRFEDEDQDGIADGPPSVLYGSLPGALTGLRRADSLVFVTSVMFGNERITVLRTGLTPGDPLTLVGSIRLAFPSGWIHKSYALALRPTPGLAGAHDLFFNIGARTNDTATTGPVVASGLLSASLNGDAIYKITVEDTGDGVRLSTLIQVATGLRNAAGIDIDRVTGDLYFEDNGIDGLVDANEPVSADELNRIPAADIGAAVWDFGFPDDYIEYRTGVRVGTGGTQPLVTFQPLDGVESEGPAEIAVAPTRFPAGLNTGVFVGFHGKFSAAGLPNEENPLVYWDRTTGLYCHFISNDEPDVGHLDGLLATEDSLFVTDMASNGSTGASGAGRGVIYQIKAAEPASLSVSPASVAPGSNVAATWSGIASPTARDWIGLYRVGSADDGYLAWTYVSCSTTPGSGRAFGSCPFALPASLPPGSYELRLFANEVFMRLATSGGFMVTGPRQCWPPARRAWRRTVPSLPPVADCQPDAHRLDRTVPGRGADTPFWREST